MKLRRNVVEATPTTATASTPMTPILTSLLTSNPFSTTPIKIIASTASAIWTGMLLAASAEAPGSVNTLGSCGSGMRSGIRIQDSSSRTDRYTSDRFRGG